MDTKYVPDYDNEDMCSTCHGLAETIFQMKQERAELVGALETATIFFALLRRLKPEISRIKGKRLHYTEDDWNHVAALLTKYQEGR